MSFRRESKENQKEIKKDNAWPESLFYFLLIRALTRALTSELGKLDGGKRVTPHFCELAR